ncbi:MAG: methionine--tRNA ligase, partial [bacterium]|nr:methionine--tRNA ligase [bacterium]
MKFYITTSIPYVNAPPHIGFALEIVQADVLARWHRLLGEEVWFLTGADEHGSKIVKTAAELGRPIEELIEENAAKFKALREILNLSNDDFIHTSDTQRHWPAAQKFWQILADQGDIYKGVYKGYYCEGCEAYLKEKEITELCCIIHKKPVQALEEENYFFRLSKYGPKIKELIEKDELRIIPEERKNEILSLIEEGLEDVSFSRLRSVLPWGIPVPGDENQVIYVWCDALINYISALDFAGGEASSPRFGEAGEKFKKFWPADVQVIGKDILRFHAAIWPAMLLSAGLALPKTIFAHGFITIEGEKMSKSLDNFVAPDNLVKKYGSDALRYWLLREISPTDDGDFSAKRFDERYHADLANGLGNLISRIFTLAENYGRPLKIFNFYFQEKIDEAWRDYRPALDNFEFNEALAIVWKLLKAADGYIDEKKPWELIKAEPEEFENVMSNLLLVLTNLGWLILPFLPQTGETILKELGL